QIVLHGDDVKTNPNIIALARVDEVKYTDEWLSFEAVFNYSTPIDHTLLSDFGYNLTIVFSSSRGGAKFEGAVGSTLCIDKVTLECKQNTDRQ
ncbi:MAG: PCMD domain-containing protein, partial [Prevotella sp.]